MQLLTFKNAADIDKGVDFLGQEALPIFKAQNGYQGITASAHRANGVFAMIFLWETEEDRHSSISALSKALKGAQGIVGGTLTVENYEQVVARIAKSPTAGSALVVTRVSMNPAIVDEGIAFFENEIAPEIATQPNFMALRYMVDRAAGRAVFGTVWDCFEAMELNLEALRDRRSRMESRGFHIDETSTREIVLVDAG